MSMKSVVPVLAFLFAFVLTARADGQFQPPVPVRTTAPVFPRELRSAGISGVVFVNCLIDEHGAVTDMKVEKTTNAEFVEPALTALKKWRFKPAERDGTKVAIRVSIPIRFSLDS
jgi:protein TonB